MVLAVTPNELATLLASIPADHPVDLIDVRGPAEFAEGHLPGTRNVPLDLLRDDPDAVLAHDSTLVFVCAKGVRSLAAAKLAERFGYARIYNLEGGTKEWARLGFDLATDAARIAA